MGRIAEAKYKQADDYVLKVFEYSGSDYKEYFFEHDYTCKRHISSYVNSVVGCSDMQSVAEIGLSDLRDTQFEVAVDRECMTLYDICVDDGNDVNAENNGLNEAGDPLALEGLIRTGDGAEIICLCLDIPSILVH